MNIFKKTIRFFRKHQSEYFFAWGANIEVEMLEAIIGRKPEFISNVVMSGYELCVQTLIDIPTSGANPRAILHKAWGDNFKSYAIRESRGQKVAGTLYKITSYERKMVDAWELVPEGWFKSDLVEVTDSNGKKYKARTQVLPASHNTGKPVDGLNYKPWIVPKEDLLRIAKKDSKRYPGYVY